MLKNFYASFLLISLFLFSCSGLSPVSKTESCREVRGAVDIGSGTTKALAALVDTCERKILERLFDQKLAIAFIEQRNSNDGKNIPPEFAKSSAIKIKPMIEKMRSLGAKKITVASTAALRDSANGSDIAKIIGKEISTPVQILSQDEEALWGAQSAILAAQVPASEVSRVVIWDIGGGSMQMWHQPEQNSPPYTYKGDLASVTFKNRIIKELKKQNPQKVSSPNPLGKFRTPSIRMAARHAYENIPTAIREQAKKLRWLGIGGVLAISVQRQVSPDSTQIQKAKLAQTLLHRSKLDDSEVGGDYPSTDISNLALVLGYMQSLGIDTIETVNASLAEALLFN